MTEAQAVHNFQQMAEEMSNLTCELAKTCNDKEKYFASTFNITPAEFRCLRLFTNRSSLSIKELGSEMNLTPGRVTHILTSLEEKKFIKRTIDENDKRNIIVHLTSKSKPFLNNLNDNHIRLHEDILEKIPSEKRDLVISAMKDLLKALKSWSENRN
jgi:DNA-binding MarR family transcriptional regulator